MVSALKEGGARQGGGRVGKKWGEGEKRAGGGRKGMEEREGKKEGRKERGEATRKEEGGR